ncbi:GNAT family N-acetyltransferase [Gordonia hankookensis]
MGMTDLDLATTRRDITDALLTALERRHEVLDAIVDAENRAEAVATVATLLGKSKLGAEAILGMSLEQLTKDERRKNQAELDDLNNALTFTLAERPASSGDTLELRAFTADDADLFKVRTEELKVAGDGSGSPAGDLSDEIAKATERVDNEDAVWLVALEGTTKVGLVFGELINGEVDVRIWIHPEHRKKGYGTAALRKSRSEMAADFPGVPMVVRAPSA